MNFDDLTEGQKAKVRACTTSEELMELAKAEGVELADEQLEAIAGGGIAVADCPVKWRPPSPSSTE